MQFWQRGKALFILGILLICFNTVMAPQAGAEDPIRMAVKTELAAMFKGPVRIGDVYLSNLSRITAKDLIVYDPEDTRKRLLEVDEISLQFSFFSLLLNLDNVAKALREIVLKGPQIVLARDEDGNWNLDRLVNSQPGGDVNNLEVVVEDGLVLVRNLDKYMPEIPVRINGQLKIDGDGMEISRLTVDAFDVTLNAKGSFSSEKMDVVMSATDFQLEQLMSHFPQVSDLRLDAVGSVKVWAQGSLTDPVVRGTVEAEAGRIGLRGVSERTYAIDRAFAAFAYDSGSINVDDFSVVAGSQVVRGRGSAAARGEVDLEVSGENVHFARYLPVIAEARITGPADFTGKVYGTLKDPVLECELTKASGKFLGVPVDKAVGKIHLSLDRFAFTDVRVQKGTALVEMNGAMNYGKGSTAEIEVVATDIDARDLLTALHLDPVASGKLTGKLRFNGPFAAMTATGDIRLTDGFLGEQEVDIATARFSVGPERAKIEEAAIRLDGGTIDLVGETAENGEFLLQMQAEAVPLRKIEFFEDIETGLAGLVSFQGTALVSGSLTNPHAQLRVDVSRGDKVAVGPAVRLDFNYSGTQMPKF